jgi:hypothetical protein
MIDGRVVRGPCGGHMSLLNSNSSLVDRTWINWRPGGPRRGKRETVGWEGRGVACGKLAPSRV